jgi:hypothetical protein
VDRTALRASGAVSPRMLGEVAALAARCGGRAALLLDALLRGEVAGFKRRKVDALRAWLVEHDYLDAAAPLAPAELRAAVVGAAMADVAAGTLAGADVERLLRRAAHGAEGDGVAAPAASPLSVARPTPAALAAGELDA